MRIKNIVLALIDQGPLLRFARNFFVTRNAWGLFHINSHINQKYGKPKVAYKTKQSALKAKDVMEKKLRRSFSAYKCVYCDGYHLGGNRH